MFKKFDATTKQNPVQDFSKGPKPDPCSCWFYHRWWWGLNAYQNIPSKPMNLKSPTKLVGDERNSIQ